MRREDIKINIYGIPEIMLIQAVDDNDIKGLDEELKIIRESTSHGFIHVAVKIEDWNDDLSPWSAPAVFGKHDFKGKGKSTLDLIINEVIPEVMKDNGLSPDIPIIIGGYSLAALFALWACYESDMFSACATSSGSLWFPGWMDYIENRDINTRVVYLSLGDKEHMTKNKVMAMVRDNTERTFERLCNDPNVRRSEFFSESGNHFMDAPGRTARGFIYCINELLISENEKNK